MRKSNEYERLAASLRDKTWKRRTHEHGCWPFLGSMTSDGRWKIWAPELQKMILVPHAVWLVEHGDLPDGMYAMACSRLKDCCNPDHITLGTASDIRRKSGNSRRTHGRPIRHRMTKEQIKEILLSDESAEDLGARLGYSVGHIKNIQYRQKYRQYIQELEDGNQIVRISSDRRLSQRNHA